VHLANSLQRGARMTEGTENSDPIDLAYIERLGLQGELDGWRALAGDLPEEL
jgi:hypothetical protein